MTRRNHTQPPTDSIFVGHEVIEEVAPHGAVTHTEHSLTYIKRGWIEIDHGGVVRAGAGTLTIVPAGVPHQSVRGHDLEYWLLSFCASCLDIDETQRLMAPFRSVRRGHLPVLKIERGRRSRVLRLFADLEEECGRDTVESPELRRSLVLIMLGETLRAMPAADAAAPEGSLVANALEFVQEHCLEPISLKEVAAAVYRTPTHVAAMVKQATSYSVGEWIAAGRLTQAATRLAHTDDSVEQIGTDVGWKDQTHFIRRFRKAFGATPAVWRREHRQSHHGPVDDGSR